MYLEKISGLSCDSQAAGRPSHYPNEKQENTAIRVRLPVLITRDQVYYLRLEVERRFPTIYENYPNIF